jgi:hypothetical protein
MEISTEVSQKLKTELPHDPAIPFLSCYPKECKSAYDRETCTPMFIAVLFTIANYEISLGVHQLMNVGLSVCTHIHGVYSAIKTREIMIFAGKWIEQKIIMLSEISQTKKGKYYMFCLICRFEN